MLRLVNKILILSLLLVMPIQGIAASVSHLLCPPTPSAELMNTGSGHQHDYSVAAQEHGHEGNSNNDGSNNHDAHLSCHQVSSGIQGITVLVVFVNSVPVYPPSSFSSPRLFFPEQPQRPPRA